MCFLLSNGVLKSTSSLGEIHRQAGEINAKPVANKSLCQEGLIYLPQLCSFPFHLQVGWVLAAVPHGCWSLGGSSPGSWASTQHLRSSTPHTAALLSPVLGNQLWYQGTEITKIC